MQFNENRRTPGILFPFVVATMAVMFLPMGPGTPQTALEAATPAHVSLPTTIASAPPAKPARSESVRKPRPATPFPQIEEIIPAPGSVDVDPALNEIRVTFDRDMNEGMSWTGGRPHFPQVDKSRKAHWIDRRTCVLPVTLKRAAYYRLGVNSKSHQNFRSTNGRSARPAAIFFTTKGATRSLQNKVLIPKIVEINPANGATDVDATTTQIQVTFDVPMGGGMSWTGGGETFPDTPNGKRAAWSKDRRTCTLPVVLQPNREYRLGLNSQSHNNFQSKWGVPLPPVVYSIRTGTN